MNNIIGLILQAINAVIAEIAAIRGQAGQTDEQLDAQTQQLLAANDALYAALKAALPPVVPKAPPTPAA